MKIGEKIRSLRIARGWKIIDLANAIGSDVGNVSRLERGKQGYSEATINKIATALGVSVSDLFQGNNNSDTVNKNSAINDIPKGLQLYRIDILDVSASAGHGSIAGSDVIDIVHSIEYASDQAKIMFGSRPESVVKVINVRGDSMSGTLEPGDLIFVDISVRHFDGDGIYVFAFDGKIHVKRLQTVPDKILVLSDNHAYREWFIDKDNEDRFFIHGKVLISQTQAYRRHG